MPDCRISRVRFEALAFPPCAFPAWRGLSAGTHTPRLPRFAHSFVPQQTSASRQHCVWPPRCSMEPPSAQSPFAQCWCFPHRGGVYATSSEDITPRSSLLRTHSPIPLPLLSFSLSLVQEVFAGCYQPLLPPGSSRRYLCESFLGCLVPCHGGSTKCIYLFLPPCHRPSPTEAWVGFPLKPANTTSRGSVFRGCRHFFMFRPPSLLVSQVVPTAAHIAAGQPRLLHPGRTCFVTSARTGYASRPNTGN
jgi:hypothetical protein